LANWKTATTPSGAPYVWCKRALENGNVAFPTAPLFGRFIEQAGSRPKVLTASLWR
jgi:hypothetical protein